MNYLMLTLATFAFTLSSFAQSEFIRTTQFNTKKTLAINGYDPVSYFDGEAKKGSNEIAFNYLGVSYHFSSKSNLERFKTNPKKYEPQYGGWCAYAIGDNGEKVKIDPETFKIIDGKLYLFYNFFGTNTLDLWNDNEQELFRQAENNWMKLLSGN
jgi:YHS domain-containing protein